MEFKRWLVWKGVGGGDAPKICRQGDPVVWKMVGGVMVESLSEQDVVHEHNACIEAFETAKTLYRETLERAVDAEGNLAALEKALAETKTVAAADLSRYFWHDCLKLGERGADHCRFEGTKVCTVCQLADMTRAYQRIKDAYDLGNVCKNGEQKMTDTEIMNQFREWFERVFGLRADYSGVEQQYWYDATRGKCWMAFCEGLKCAITQVEQDKKKDILQA